MVHPMIPGGGGEDADDTISTDVTVAFTEAAEKQVIEADEVREGLMRGFVPDLLQRDDLCLRGLGCRAERDDE
jgi:hypothetical protein